ncbi:plasma-membrane choline transporter-domain-containing protein [Spinellus fusiger]|nr:plasma-membrane choline transporter-domain-containing protein [Spinellus fusiger]
MDQPPPNKAYPPPPQNTGYPPPPQNTGYPPPLQNTNYLSPSPDYFANNPHPYDVNGTIPENRQEYSGKIQPPSGWNDIWAIVLWVCNMGAFIALSVIGLRTYSTRRGSYNGTYSNTIYSGITFDTGTFKIFGLSTVIGFGLSILYLFMVNMFPRPMIIITFVCSIIVYFGVTIYYLTQHYYSAAIVFLIFSCLYLICFWMWRKKIPFATVMLEIVTSITRKYPSTLMVGMVSLVIQTAFSFWFILNVIGVYETYYSTSYNNSRLNLAMVFLVFSFYWTSQVITYTTHVILSGIFATVYFMDNSIKHPVLGSARRALTTSFGSICFGSLLIAIVDLIRYFIHLGRGNVDSPIALFFLCVLDCVVGCFQGLFEWFTHYAFSGVAIYGKPFIPAAKDTWAMVKNRGIDAMINDNLIGSVLFMGGLLVGVLCSLFGFIYLEVARPVYNQGGNMTSVIVLVCFIVGSSMFSTIATVISSGVSTTFVCLAEDPQALRISKPELFEKIRETWPHLEQSL